MGKAAVFLLLETPLGSPRRISFNLGNPRVLCLWPRPQKAQGSTETRELLAPYASILGPARGPATTHVSPRGMDQHGPRCGSLGPVTTCASPEKMDQISPVLCTGAHTDPGLPTQRPGCWGSASALAQTSMLGSMLTHASKEGTCQGGMGQRERQESPSNVCLGQGSTCFTQ